MPLLQAQEITYTDVQRFRRDPSGTHLVIGKQRGGKSVLCFFLAQTTRMRPIYAITAAVEVLPEVVEDILQVPRGDVCVIDDVQLFFNSMRTGDDSYRCSGYSKDS